MGCGASKQPPPLLPAGMTPQEVMNFRLQRGDSGKDNRASEAPRFIVRGTRDSDEAISAASMHDALYESGKKAYEAENYAKALDDFELCKERVLSLQAVESPQQRRPSSLTGSIKASRQPIQQDRPSNWRNLDT